MTVSIRQAAEICGVSSTTIRRWIDEHPEFLQEWVIYLNPRCMVMNDQGLVAVQVETTEKVVEEMKKDKKYICVDEVDDIIASN